MRFLLPSFIEGRRIKMEPWIEKFITVFVAVMASSGFWAYLMKRQDKKSVKTRMLIGLGHDRIMCLGKMYINRGYITPDEYENLHDYLYEPYLSIGGNGSAKRIMQEVEKLPIKQSA